MLPLLTDEDLRGAIVNGLLFHFSAIDLLRAQDAGLRQTPDAIILEYAANHRRVVVSHDRSTMTDDAQARLNQGLPMAGLIIVDQFMSTGKAIQDLGAYAEAGDPGDLDGQIIFLS